MTKIVISGATGNIGSQLTKTLSHRGIRFRALMRPGSPRAQEKADALRALPHAEVVAADFDDPASLRRALTGAERAFLLTSSSERAEQQQLAFVAAAQESGVRHVVKLSQWGADPRSPVRFLRYHAAVEDALRNTDMTHTFLRPNLFMQALLGFRASIIQKGKIIAAAGDARVSVVDVRDIADVAAAALTEDSHEERVYSLTGPAALTHAEMAEQLASAVGRPIQYVDVPPGAMHDALLSAGFPAWQAAGLIEDYAHYRRGEAAVVTTGVEDATGIPARPFAEFARDCAAAFRPA